MNRIDVLVAILDTLAASTPNADRRCAFERAREFAERFKSPTCSLLPEDCLDYMQDFLHRNADWEARQAGALHASIQTRRSAAHRQAAFEHVSSLVNQLYG